MMLTVIPNDADLVHMLHHIIPRGVYSGIAFRKRTKKENQPDTTNYTIPYLMVHIS